jgi:hypothetical protein
MAMPLGWVLVSISLTALLADWMYAQPEAVPAPLPASTLASAAATPIESPFAYVREDGSEQFLPIPDDPSFGKFETEHARQFEGISLSTADPKIAVYTWSSPVEREALQ